ncbi:MAG: thioredoxin family protein [Metamycoplasmataceae bacterium]
MIHYLKKNENLEQMIEKSNFSFVTFSSKTCGPCLMLEPVLIDVANDKKINLFIVDIQENRELSEKHDIQATPTIKIYKKNKLVATEVGYFPYENWVEIIENFNK